VLSVIPVGLLTAPVVHLVFTVVDGGFWWLILLFISFPMLVVWWLITPALVRARATAERNILGRDRVEQLERRVEEVAASRRETLDHSAAEVRRIERDLHDGAQARIASVGMNVGLAEKLIATDPEAAAALLRAARETTVDALEDLRSVVRGIHPPALADRGLAGGLKALALPIPLPVTVTVEAPTLPPPVESAAYFAVAECLANTVKHAGASRAWVRVRHDGALLHLVVGDDGRGGADPVGSGLAGVARRLGAFDGTMVVDSPVGGPTVVTMEVPCRSSPS
jgi:signal transduction histidine kinase